MAGNVLYIRTDMNEKIATGHMMRCLSVADSAKARGADCIFITADDSARNLIAKRGYDNIVLGTEYDDMESELDWLIPLIMERKIDRLLVDSYSVTENYFYKLGEHLDVYYIDDLNSFPYPVKGVINYSNYAHDDFYHVRYPGTKYYLGCGYAPLREAFKNPEPKNIARNVKNVLLMSGGSDPYGIIPQILEKIPEGKYETLNVICGNYNTRLSEIKEKFGNRKELHVYSKVERIWQLYAEADIAISAGGSTLYELASMGVPTITYSFSDNQIHNVRSFDLDELMPCAGDVRGGNVPSRVAYFLDRLENMDERIEKSRRLQRLVDGKGADRLADVVLN